MKKIIPLAGMLCAFFCANSQTKNFIDQPYIEVAGFADTMVTPNEIFIQIALSERDTKDKLSIEELEQKMIAVLTKIGLDIEKDLTTSDMISNYKYYLLKNKDIIKTKLYELKVADAQTASRVFIDLEGVGISNTSINRVNHTEFENLKNLMRIKAITAARAKAIALSQSLNQEIGPAIHIADNENPTNVFSGQVSITLRGIATSRDEYKDPPKIEFEKIKVMASVSAKFVLE